MGVLFVFLMRGGGREWGEGEATRIKLVLRARIIHK